MIQTTTTPQTTVLVRNDCTGEKSSFAIDRPRWDIIDRLEFLVFAFRKRPGRVRCCAHVPVDPGSPLVFRLLSGDNSVTERAIAEIIKAGGLPL